MSTQIDELKTDAQNIVEDGSDSSGDEAWPERTTPSGEVERAPAERHAFLFRHNLNAEPSDIRKFQPLPSQIPFLLDVFADNINIFSRIVHMPTVTKMVRNLHSSGNTRLTPSNEALMFSIYYAATTSMEEDDVSTSDTAGCREPRVENYTDPAVE